MSLSELCEKAINAVIRPPRREYNPSEIPLFFRASDNKLYIRHPLNFRNSRHQKIVGSLYVMDGIDAMSNIPCVLYLHGNASCQYEGQFLVPNLCPYGIAVYCFDFAGCGASGGDYISLGYYEQQDVELVLTSLTNSFQFSKYVLWGRSMGAATAILVNHPLLVGRISDSTYTSINEVCSAIAASMGVPHLLITPALWYLRYNVSSIANFNMSTVSPEESAKTDMPVPLLIGHADDDEFIPLEQGQRVFKAYQCPDKQFFILHGGHNGKRNTDWIEKCSKFCFRVLGIQANDYKPSTSTGFIESDFVPHFGNIKEMMAAADAAKAKSHEKESEHKDENLEKEENSSEQQENEITQKIEINKENKEELTESTEEIPCKEEKIQQQNENKEEENISSSSLKEEDQNKPDNENIDPNEDQENQ